jgi:hypothetical protein
VIYGVLGDRTILTHCFDRRLRQAVRPAKRASRIEHFAPFQCARLVESERLLLMLEMVDGTVPINILARFGQLVLISQSTE